MKHLVLLIWCLYCILVNATSSKDNCDYYLQLEQQHRCMLKNITYYTHYGYYYCSYFLKIKSNFSPALANWIEETALCLQERMQQYSDKHSNESDFSCHEMERYAFSNHAACYRESGFCKLGPFDQMRIVKNLIGLDLFFKLGPSLQQALKIGVDCTIEHLQSYERCSLL